MLLAFVSYPLYKMLQRRVLPGRRGLAAMAMTLAAAALLVLPMSFAAILITQDFLWPITSSTTPYCSASSALIQ